MYFLGSIQRTWWVQVETKVWSIVLECKKQQKIGRMNVESVVDKLAQDIRSEDAIHGPVVKDLAKLAASSAVTEEDFHATFLKALGR